MQHSSHIITSSNVLNKKLAFQGWEKCVEAFSQGKGSLSHHCARLMKSQEPSQHEVLISWSSSDEDADEGPESSWLRPSRTLASQIDFGDCTSIRKKGRRQTSARFYRSIEKQVVRELDGKTDIAQKGQIKNQNDQEANTQTHESVASGSSLIDQGELSTHVCSENPDDSTQTSLLNRRIILSNDNQHSEAFSQPLCSSFTMLTPDSCKKHDDYITSPVFKINKSISKRRSRGISEKTFVDSDVWKKQQVKRSNSPDLEQSVESHLSLCSTDQMIYNGLKSPEVSPQNSVEMFSPVLGKSVSQRRKCAPKMAVDESLSPILGKVRGCKTVCCDKSPILGFSKKTMPFKRKRKEPSRGAFDPSPTVSKADSAMCMDATQSNDHKNSEPAVLLPKWSLVGEDSIKDDQQTNLEVVSAKRSLDFSSPQHRISHLKSVESGSKLPIPKDVVRPCVHAPRESKSRGPVGNIGISISKSSEIDNHCVKSSYSHNQIVDGKDATSSPVSVKYSDHLLAEQTNSPQHSQNESYSRIIEEDNTERLQEDLKLQKAALSTIKTKRKSLSLKKKTVIRNSSNKDAHNFESKQSNNKIIVIDNDCIRGVAKTKNCLQDILMTSKEKQSVTDTCLIEDNCSQNNPARRADFKLPSRSKTQKVGALLYDHKSSSNLSCCIEDVNSESPFPHSQLNEKGTGRSVESSNVSLTKPQPQWKYLMEYPNQNPLDVREQFSKDQHSMVHNCKGRGDIGEDALEIDSSLSLSPDSVSHPQSNHAASPVSISQSSSPPAPCPVLPLPTVPPVDDFDTPPRKGKKKLQVGGLANRLQRLLNRQRSSASIWQFQRSKQSSKRPEILGGSSTASGSNGQNDGTLITVHRTWVEYSHVLVHGSLAEEQQNNCTLSNSVIVVLDLSVAERLGRIMTASIIRIFPPWQALSLKGTSIVLCVTCIEVVSSSVVYKEPKKKICIMKEFGCSCVDGILQQNCSEHNGLLLSVHNNTPIKLLDLFFPEIQVAFPCSLTTATERLIETEVPNKNLNIMQESLSELVTSHCSGGTVNRLTATVLRIFKFWQPVRLQSKESSPTWSLLVKDSHNEICEILLGSKCPSHRTLWENVESGRLLGKVCRFSGLIPTKRIYPFKSSSMWSVANSIFCGSCEQTVLYVLSHSTTSWDCKSTKDGISFPFNFSELRKVITQTNSSEPQRFNINCRLLQSNHEILYVTDSSLFPKVRAITVQPTVYLPLTLSSAVLLTLRDIEAVSGELRADKYSRVEVLDLLNVGEDSSHNMEHLQSLTTLKPTLPLLHVGTPSRTLASLLGTIVGIDEETAFMWPACGHCGNELLCADAGSETYRCEKCINLSEEVILRMSLQVIVSCKDLPRESKIRVKLLQSTIEKLLPPSPCSKEGYDMNTVLGRQLGPLNCEVLVSQGGDFVLQELPPFN